MPDDRGGAIENYPRNRSCTMKGMEKHEVKRHVKKRVREAATAGLSEDFY